MEDAATPEHQYNADGADQLRERDARCRDKRHVQFDQLPNVGAVAVPQAQHLSATVAPRYTRRLGSSVERPPHTSGNDGMVVHGRDHATYP